MLEGVRERRRFPRAGARIMLGYARRLDHVRFAVLGIGTALDLGANGLRFVAYEVIPERSRLELQLVLDGRAARIGEARVLRVKPRGDGSFEVAVEFLDADPRARLTIDAYVRERLESQRAA